MDKLPEKLSPLFFLKKGQFFSIHVVRPSKFKKGFPDSDKGITVTRLSLQAWEGKNGSVPTWTNGEPFERFEWGGALVWSRVGQLYLSCPQINAPHTKVNRYIAGHYVDPEFYYQFPYLKEEFRKFNNHVTINVQHIDSINF